MIPKHVILLNLKGNGMSETNEYDDEILIDAKRDGEKLQSWKDRREKELGFRPQHEIFHNHYLPYASPQLDDESKKLLSHIKDNLGKSIASREIYPSAGIYITKLMR